MATSDVNALGLSDLNQFLYAEIGTEPNGTALNMLSVFARLGFDPWSEAGKLAVLSKSEAADSLARTIAAMPKTPWPLPDARAIADRLTGLLPSRPLMGMSPVGMKQAARQFPSGWAGRLFAGRMPLVFAGAALLLAFAVLVATQ